MSEFLAVTEVAELLGVSEKWVYVNKKHLPGYLKINKLIRFNKKILLKELEEQALRPGPNRGTYSGNEDRHNLAP